MQTDTAVLTIEEEEQRRAAEVAERCGTDLASVTRNLYRLMARDSRVPPALAANACTQQAGARAEGPTDLDFLESIVRVEAERGELMRRLANNR